MTGLMAWLRALRLSNQLTHLAHRLLKADKHRVRDNRVADVQLVNPRHGGQRLNIVVVQTVTGVNH